MKDDTQLIMEAIHGAVEKATQQIAEEEIKKAQAAIEQRVRGEVARIACVIFSNLRFERFGRDLRIVVQFPGGKDPQR